MSIVIYRNKHGTFHVFSAILCPPVAAYPNVQIQAPNRSFGEVAEHVCEARYRFYDGRISIGVTCGAIANWEEPFKMDCLGS